MCDPPIRPFSGC